MTAPTCINSYGSILIRQTNEWLIAGSIAYEGCKSEVIVTIRIKVARLVV